MVAIGAALDDSSRALRELWGGWCIALGDTCLTSARQLKVLMPACPIRNLVTGGAGFLGSHLVDRLMQAGEEVLCPDNTFTGRKANVRQWWDHPRFEFIRHDVTEPIKSKSTASGISLALHPRFTIRPIRSRPQNQFSWHLQHARPFRRVKARLLLASTSEVYGDPEVHPQPESYRGCVNPIGIRACYDEGKRIAETLCFDYQRMHGSEIRIARIFNTYGPRMLVDDGRVVSNFIVQALRGEPITLYGDAARAVLFVMSMI